MTRRWFLLALPPLVLLAVAFALVRLVLEFDQGEADRKAAERLTLYRQTILGEYHKYRYLPYMIARDPRATTVLRLGVPSDDANRFLQEMAENSGVDLLYVMNAEGTTLATSNWREQQTLIGENYGFRPYFKEAMEGREGQYFAIGLTTGRPGLFLARPTPVDGDPVGVAVVKVDMRSLEEAWADGGEIVFASDANGVIFLSSRPEWRYRTLEDLSPADRAAIEAARQYSGQGLQSISTGVVGPGGTLTIEGRTYRHNSATVGLLDWTLHFLVPVAETRRNLWIIWAAAIGLSLVYAVVVLVFRGRRLRRASARLKQESADLRELNIRLVGEIQERKRVESELLEAQKVLARSSRLAAVGEMSAAVVHELSQPLAALRMFIAGTRKFLEKGDSATASSNLDEIDALQHRMASLTHELKRFARPSESRIEKTDLRDCIRAAEKIVRPHFETTGVCLELNVPGEPLIVETAPLRIEQILVNLLRNGADAAGTEENGTVSVHTNTGKRTVSIRVADNGEGVPEEIRERIFDPFFSTKDSTGGMGLGLAISMRIAEDLGGELLVRANMPHGAVFELVLPDYSGPAGTSERQTSRQEEPAQ